MKEYKSAYRCKEMKQKAFIMGLLSCKHVVVCWHWFMSPGHLKKCHLITINVTSNSNNVQIICAIIWVRLHEKTQAKYQISLSGVSE